MMYMSPQNNTLQKHNADNSIWGVIITPYNNRKLTLEYKVCIDNGNYSKEFSWSSYKKFLDSKLPYKHIINFVTVPDKVASHKETILLYKQYSDSISKMGYNISFVLQDGCGYDDIPTDCSWLFVGGTTEYKLSKQVADIIVKTNKPVHVGRVNSEKRIRYFYELGVKSVDGTTICYQPDIVFNKLNNLLLKLHKEHAGLFAYKDTVNQI